MSIIITVALIHLIMRIALFLFLIGVAVGICGLCYWLGLHDLYAERKQRPTTKE